MNEENDSLIGFDPLAWMKEEDEAAPAPSPAGPAAEAPEAPPATAREAAPPKPEPAPPAAEVPPAEPVAEETVAGDDGDSVVALGDTLDIAHVAALYERLSGALGQGREPALDGSELERVDAAGLQLLCAYGRELKGLGHTIEWRGEPSEALRDAASLLDVSETLGLAA